MHDDDSGSEQQGSWEPPGYVSPWMPASSSGDQSQDSDTVSFGGAPGYSPDQGYVPPGYVPPGYVPPPGYGGQGYAPPPGYAGPPWSGYGAPPPPPSRSGLGRVLAYLAVAVVAAGAGAGAAVALNHAGSASSLSPASGNAGNPGQTSPYGGNGFALPSGGAGPSSGTGSGTGSLNASALAAKVDPGIVDITSQLKYSDATAEGTGMVISPDGLVLTNNHVIDQATSVSATLVVSGKTFAAKVIGYDSADDVALLQLVGASNLKTVTLGNSSKVKVGQPVLALGNAGGRGGLPSTAQGTIRALNQSIEASDSGANTTEKLHGMIETNAPIQQGDSGGPLVNSAGQVIGMDTAANSAGYTPYPSATTGFAIPINHATSIASQIKAGNASASIHLGLAGFMGVNVANAASPADCSSGGFGGIGGYTPPVKSGALICDVYPGAPAQQAGLAGGDVITSVDGHAVKTADGLTKLMASDHPGDNLTVNYVDQYGTKHTTTVTLTEWAK